MAKTNTIGLARAIRIKSLRMVHAAKASHIGSSLSMADILAVLYGGIMRYDPARPDWTGRDMLLVSKGHACTIMYAVLAEVGFFDSKQLATYGTDGTTLQGHLSHHVPGVELSTGSLGHGLPVACGLAYAAKSDGVDRTIYAILSDGELDEGSNWEAILFAGHQQLSHLVTIVDYNKIQSFGSVKEVLDLEPLADKWRACNWHVIEVEGHDHDALKSAFNSRARNKPTVIIAHTIKGKGVDFMEGQLAWHYKSPSDEQLADAIAQLEAVK
ncbi:MAG: transketolase [Alphaproteobacteria bacterium]